MPISSILGLARYELPALASNVRLKIPQCCRMDGRPNSAAQVKNDLPLNPSHLSSQYQSTAFNVAADISNHCLVNPEPDH